MLGYRARKQAPVTDTRLSSNGKFLREMGTVPVNLLYLLGKIPRVEVQQMSLSREAFDYWHAIQSQQEGIEVCFSLLEKNSPIFLKSIIR